MHPDLGGNGLSPEELQWAAMFAVAILWYVFTGNKNKDNNDEH